MRHAGIFLGKGKLAHEQRHPKGRKYFWERPFEKGNKQPTLATEITGMERCVANQTIERTCGTRTVFF